MTALTYVNRPRRSTDHGGGKRRAVIATSRQEMSDAGNDNDEGQEDRGGKRSHPLILISNLETIPVWPRPLH